VATENGIYRLTYYHPNDSTGSGFRTGSGLGVEHFTTNDKGWYLYKGKLVVATATTNCLKAKSGVCGKWNTPTENKKYFTYGDQITIEIDGIKYQAIVLDSCGRSMTTNTIDLYVKDGKSGINRKEIKVEYAGK